MCTCTHVPPPSLSLRIVGTVVGRLPRLAVVVVKQDTVVLTVNTKTGTDT